MTTGLLLLGTLAGCQGKLATLSYTRGFEGPILQMYEEHVLANLARRAKGQLVVQMNFSGFSSSATYGSTMNGQLEFFDTSNATANAGRTTSALNPAFWKITPSVGSNLSGTVGFVANPATNQVKILAHYDAEAARSDSERIFLITKDHSQAKKGYAVVRLGTAEWAYVPCHKARAFCDFVTRVCFYPQDAPSEQAPTVK